MLRLGVFPVILLRPNAAVERRRAGLSSAPHAHNEMAHVRRARDDVSPESSYEKVDTRWLVALALELNRRSVSERRV
jgi:hypothetical protein